MEWRLSPYGEEYDNSRKLGVGEWGGGGGGGDSRAGQNDSQCIYQLV